MLCARHASLVFLPVHPIMQKDRKGGCVCIFVCSLLNFFLFLFCSLHDSGVFWFSEREEEGAAEEKKKLHSFCISDQDIQMTPLFFLFFCLLVRVFSSLLSIIFFCLFFFFPARHINTSSREFVDDKTRMDKTNTRI